MAVSPMASVLVVDDDADSREVIRELLEETGYTVTDVASAIAALSYLREAPDCVVLFDYVMFGDNGAALLREVEREDSLRRHRYVLMTGMQMNRLPQEDRELVETLCTDVVSKPFDLDVLLQRVAQVAATLSNGAESSSVADQ